MTFEELEKKFQQSFHRLISTIEKTRTGSVPGDDQGI
jgi:hypothetical protein